MATAIAQLPLIEGSDTLRDNEDWLFSLAFQTAGQATGYAATGNTGNGTLGSVVAFSGAGIGNSTLTVTAVAGGIATFLVTDPDGNSIGIGASGAAFNQGGLSFTLTSGTVPFVIGDTFVIAVLGKPIDLTGLSFAMQVRSATPSATIYAKASTTDGGIINGTTAGVISVSVARSAQPIPVGTYGFDILASGDGLTRCCVAGTLSVVPGYTHTA